MDQLPFGHLLDGETEPPAAASDSVGSGPCSVKVPALCPAPEETSQGLRYLESWQRRGESVSFPASAVVEALMPDIFSTNVVAEAVEPGKIATKTARRTLSRMTSLESFHAQRQYHSLSTS